MTDPNEILGQIQMVCAEIARSKTALGYDETRMTKLGMVVFGNAETLRDAIQAPDGQSYRSALFAEVAERERLRNVLFEVQCNQLDYATTGRSHLALRRNAMRTRNKIAAALGE